MLLVSAPVGLQFNGLTNGAIALLDSPSLSVPIGKTLALVGGDVTLQGAQLIASKGRIELGSIQGNGFLAIAQTANGWRLNYDQTPNLGNIRLEAALVEVSGINGAGSIQVQGRQVTLNDGSSILSSSLGSGDGGEIFIRAIELFAARGLDISGSFSSGVEAAVFGGDVKGSNITLTAKRVELTNGGIIITGTFGAGKAGDIRINASDILVTGNSQPETSRIISQTFDPNATGNSGNIIIITNNLLLSENAEVRSDTNGIGNAGIVEITAKNINLINTRNQDPASTVVTTVITSGVFDGARGNGGTVKINTDNLQMTGDTFLTASTIGIGNAGNIDITAKSIFLDSSSSPFNRAFIFNGSFQDATGNGGEVKITTDSLLLKDGGQISANTQSISGNAGNLLINAKFIDIFGENSTYRSGLFANALVGTGNGGNIEVNSDRLILRDRGIISTSSFPDQQIGADPNFSGSKGSVGNITINSPSIVLDQGSINIDSLNGSRGNINLNSNLILLRNGSSISTNALGNATGGNIRINTNFLVGVPSENSDITANSINNFGGKVDITARTVIGFQLINRLTPLSDITATSSLGAQFNGLVEIRSPNIDLSRGLVKLPDNLTDASKQIVTACDRLRGNEFIVTGRGGLAADATKVFSSQAIWRDLRLAEIPSTQSNPTIKTTASRVVTQPNPPVGNIQPIPQLEAQSWEQSANGNLKLLAYAASTSEPVWRLPVICPPNPR